MASKVIKTIREIMEEYVAQLKFFENKKEKLGRLTDRYAQRILKAVNAEYKREDTSKPEPTKKMTREEVKARMRELWGEKNV